MNDEIGDGIEATTPVWAAFGDLMSVLLGAFVLILVGIIGMQLKLSSKLENGVKQREVETQRRKTLEQAPAGPLATGRVTLVSGRIGINGGVLFAINSDQLQPEGHALVKSLAGPLAAYLTPHEKILMMSDFSDDQQMHTDNRLLADDWEPSAKRVLTVTHALIDEGIPASSVFVAAFGLQQPVSSNVDDVGCAKNRCVEIAPVPRQAASNGGRREPH